MQPTAKLDNWVFAMHGGRQVIEGDIHGDIKNRYPDGTRVRTSAVICTLMVNNVTHVRTVYSVYLLGKKFEEQSPAEWRKRYRKQR